MIHAETNQIEHYKPLLRLVANSVLTPPSSLRAEVEGGVVNLTWDMPIAPHVTLLGYNVYRNDELINIALITTNIFVDSDEKVDGDYVYQVTAVYDHGESRMSNPVEVRIEVSDDDEVEPLLRTELGGNFPNPFNPETSIRYQVSGIDGQFVQIHIYNMRGQRVKTLVDERVTIGVHSVVWDGTDSVGQSVSSGIYLYKMVTDDFSEIKKMMLLK